MFFKTSDCVGEIILDPSLKIGMPGDNIKCIIRLENYLVFQKQQHFAIRESGKTIGYGVVTEIIQKDSIPLGV